ncbi:MAG: Glutamate--cysteine ligase [Gemmatimonadaceae bacterium]|nr:Glutamate--cysteine ligase [Gemmatimonadaceae bacterium]
MARTIDRTSFLDAEYAAFAERLESNLRALRMVLDRPGFGDGDPSLGAELEFSIVDDRARPLMRNTDILKRCADPRLGLELDRFNLEFNLTPVSARGHPFSHMEAEVAAALDMTNRLAAAHGGRVVPIGILPTLTEDDLQASALTDAPRYQALSAGVRRLRHAPSVVRICGEDVLQVTSADIALEGANTSFQVHYRVPPRDFARAYNAAQLALPVAMAVSSNSPTFLGRRLWDETRIALFKQALDYRDLEATRWRPPTRVGFGHGWLRRDAWEAFAESVALFPAIFPIVDDEDAEGVAATGGVPRLRELRLHQGTIWRWNRAIYDPGFDGHLRIEMRALPSGPTPVDMVAGAALLTGLTRALTDRMDDLLPRFPFAYAEYNFYRAAQYGLGASLLWPGGGRCGESPMERPAVAVVRDALPMAEAGLEALGVDSAEATRLLGIVRGRVDSGVTAARWQRRCFERLSIAHRRDEALAELVELYLVHSRSGRPVHEWPDA